VWATSFGWPHGRRKVGGESLLLVGFGAKVTVVGCWWSLVAVGGGHWIPPFAFRWWHPRCLHAVELCTLGHLGHRQAILVAPSVESRSFACSSFLQDVVRAMVLSSLSMGARPLGTRRQQPHGGGRGVCRGPATVTTSLGCRARA
jgi:hypothetical protein